MFWTIAEASVSPARPAPLIVTTLSRLLLGSMLLASASACGPGPAGEAEPASGNDAARLAEQRAKTPAAPQGATGAGGAGEWLLGRWGRDGACASDDQVIEFRNGGGFDAYGSFGAVTWRLGEGSLLHVEQVPRRDHEARPPEGLAREIIEPAVWTVARVKHDAMTLTAGRELRFIRCEDREDG
ncbi:MAG TPA: hypothetical protein VGB08_02315 [Allosphingosinicella sp.]